MTFPVYFDFLGLHLHPHPAAEVIAYFCGFQLYLYLRRKQPVTIEKGMWLIVACVFGALLGSKLLAWLESWPEYWNMRNDPRMWLGGKTMVGGLLGGWAGVEIAKRCMGIVRRTGDAFVFPLIIGISIGRIGCFLTGLDDHTHGVATSLPWGVDFGDGVRRHPTQLYEIAFLIMLGIVLLIRARSQRREGEFFRLFILSYLLFRLSVEFIKPTYRPYLGLSAIQIVSAVGAGFSLWQLVHLYFKGKQSHETTSATA